MTMQKVLPQTSLPRTSEHVRRSPKIAIISDHASPLADLGRVDSGGQNIYVGQTARHLSALGCQVDVFTRRDDPSLPDIMPWENGVRIIHVPAGPPEFVRKEDLLGYMQEFTDYMIQFCSRATEPYDLVHANFWMSGLVAADLKQALGIPFVITFHALGRVRRLHQGKADGFPKKRFEIEDRLVAEAETIIAECPQDKEDLLQLYKADPSKITIIPCGVDPDELWPLDKTLSRKVLRLPQKEFIILQLGRMVPRKGVDTVIRGFARLIKEQDISARLLIIGGESDEPDPQKTPEIGRLQSIAAEEGVIDRVTFVGRRGREALKHYYSAADIFVSTPWYEPFGITPIEAMACGTPVIGSNVGGIKYTVVDGETGFLIPPKDPETLAERLAELLRDPELLERFREESLRRVNEHFTWEKVAAALCNVYERVLASSSCFWRSQKQ
jgi:glycosyltransferase involved in cell wall biosynthesis